MKSKDHQKVVLSKYEKGDTPKQIYHHLNGGLGLRTIERWSGGQALSHYQNH